MGTRSAPAAADTADNPLDEAFTHIYRIRAMTDALQECGNLDPGSITGLAAMAFAESCGLLDCLTALSEERAK